MKIRLLNRLFPLLLIAFLNAFSGIASSYSHQSLDLDSRNYDYLQEEQNRHAFIFQEISVSFYFQEISKNSPGVVDLISFYPSFAPYYEVKTSISPGYLLDKRSALEHQIFPFHFFW